MCTSSWANVLTMFSWTRVAIALLLLAGLIVRLLPLVDADRHLYWLFMSEDGYLMQTVARNIAIGLGMSTAAGTIATNGVQPLATFVYAGLHALAGGSRSQAIAYVTAVSAIVSALSAWMLWRLGRLVLRQHDQARDAAPAAAALWFASPLVIGHSMNGLETGIYYLAIVSSLVYYFSLDTGDRAGLRPAQRIALGILLGVTFLARNDAVFFIAAVLLAHLCLGGDAGGGWRRRAVDSIVAGIASILVASPWLIYNRTRFGSIVPISGSAQSHDAGLGGNLAALPANLIEAAIQYLPIPRDAETSWPVIAVASMALLAMGWAAWHCFRELGLRGRRFVLLASIFCAGLSGYYGLFFGAPHFLSRYLSALTPLLALLGVATALALLARLRIPQAQGAILVAVLGMALLISTARAALHFRAEPNNGHRQVVEWVAQNVEERQWAGAIQTGTLGYFHDRTINLDGKVNPAALRETVRSGDVRPYVIHETPISYLADWVEIADWVSPAMQSEFDRTFEVLVADREANLGVLRRIVPPAQ